VLLLVRLQGARATGGGTGRAQQLLHRRGVTCCHVRLGLQLLWRIQCLAPQPLLLPHPFQLLLVSWLLHLRPRQFCGRSDPCGIACYKATPSEGISFQGTADVGSPTNCAP